MGTDISGFLEYRAPQDHQEPTWHTAHDLGSLYLGRDYDASGCLFGVRNYADFPAPSPHTGVCPPTPRPPRPHGSPN
ncbi:hypothetical protein AB0K51_04160 [Kitasatospora sp. NPDC049285]|uniref:hypothetical protein n=1 Tax=Kitasatospora sp. NPDC049285 TaxID=3157096 RepID=UPI0034366177